MSNTIRNKVFISYSHKDKEWLNKIQIHLKPLVRTNPILVWDDRKIEAGAKWKEEVAEALDSAKVALLLVSPDFLASDFIAEHELPKILEAARKEGLKILWLPISSCAYEDTEIIEYQGANDDDLTPLDEFSSAKQNQVFANLFRKIKKALEEPLHPNLPDTDDELGEAISGIIEAAPSPYGTRGILRRYLKGTIYIIVEKGIPLAQQPSIKNDTFFKINDALIGRKYESLGGTSSKLGFPLANIGKAWDNNIWPETNFSGWVQWFEGGRIYQSGRFGAHTIFEGDILKKFVDYEEEMKQSNKEMTGGRLGFPITGEYEITSSTGAKGRVQRFIYGYIINWSKRAYRVEMGFYDLYQAIGEWKGELGFPLSDEEKYASPISKKNGVIQFFENGCTQWDYDKNQGFYIYGAIYKKWVEEKENLGFALNSVASTKNSHLQYFEGGIIEYRSGNSTVIAK